MAKLEDISHSNESAPQNATGGTGGPGGVPSSGTEDVSLPKPVPTVGAPGNDDDPMRHMLMHFQGSTGAMGGKPEPDAQVEEGKPIPQEMLQRVVENTTGQIEKLTKDEALLQLKSQHVAAEEIYASARTKMVNIGYLIGCLLAHLKSLVIAEGENWGDFSDRELPEMSRRTRDKCMNLADTPGILKHAYLGTDAAEQVIQIIKPIKHMLSKEDPISDLFERSGIKLNYAEIEKSELKLLVQAVITRQKLLPKKIDIEVQTIIDFSKVAGPVTAIDTAVMLDRVAHELSPAEYMVEVIAKNGLRPNDVSDTNSPKHPIKYINAETVKLKNSIDRLLEEEVNLKKLDKTHLEALRTAVDNLLRRFSN